MGDGPSAPGVGDAETFGQFGKAVSKGSALSVLTGGFAALNPLTVVGSVVGSLVDPLGAVGQVFEDIQAGGALTTPMLDLDVPESAGFGFYGPNDGFPDPNVPASEGGFDPDTPGEAETEVPPPAPPAPAASPEQTPDHRPPAEENTPPAVEDVAETTQAAAQSKTTNARVQQASRRKNRTRLRVPLGAANDTQTQEAGSGLVVR